MKPANIPDGHHFVKFCKWKDLIRENGVPIGASPWAFALRKPTEARPNQEKTLSGVYYEFFVGTHFEKMHACFHCIQMEIKKKDALLRLDAASIRAQGKKRSRSLRVRHEPSPACRGYASILGLPVDTDDELCALLSNEPVREVFLVADLL